MSRVINRQTTNSEESNESHGKAESSSIANRHLHTTGLSTTRRGRRSRLARLGNSGGFLARKISRLRDALRAMPVVFVSGALGLGLAAGWVGRFLDAFGAVPVIFVGGALGFIVAIVVVSIGRGGGLWDAGGTVPVVVVRFALACGSVGLGASRLAVP